jgi:hypothetical protein
MNKKKINELKSKYNFELKIFDYSLYPEHVDLKKYNGLYCSYAFKPIIIFNEANIPENKDNILLWMDSANQFNINTVLSIYNIVKEQGIYSPISSSENTIEVIELNHPTTVKILGLTEYEHKNNLKNISANVIAIDYSSKTGFDILNNWYNFSLNKNIIMPDGSSRNNHRQDQTILSILMYLYEKNNNKVFEKKNVGVSYWNKMDPPILEEGVFPFKLFDKKTNKQLATIFCHSYDDAVKIYSDRKGIEINILNMLYIIKI